MIAKSTILLLLVSSTSACFHEIPLLLEDDGNATITTATSHLFESDSYFSLALDIPGVASKDLNVDVDYEDRRIDLTGIRHSVYGENETYLLYRQSWHIDETVNVYDLTMEHRNGCVIVCVPKKHASKIRGVRREAPATAPDIPVPEVDKIYAPRLEGMGRQAVDDDDVEYWRHKM